MARRRNPREPRPPITFEDSPAIREAADRLVRQYPAHFGWLTNFKVGYIRVEGSRKRQSSNIDVGAKFRKVTGVYHGITGLDAVVEIHGWAWKDAQDDGTAEALDAHVLCHGDMTEKGALVTVQHEIGDFRWMVANYGDWQPEIKAFAEQLALFQAGSSPYRGPTQQTLEAPTPTRKRNGSDQPPAPH
jgi:hypothetical protein